MQEVPLRPELTSRYPHLTPERVDAFVQDIKALAVHIAAPPNTSFTKQTGAGKHTISSAQ